jgi:hypothetical protein
VCGLLGDVSSLGHTAGDVNIDSDAAYERRFELQSALIRLFFYAFNEGSDSRVVMDFFWERELHKPLFCIFENMVTALPVTDVAENPDATEEEEEEEESDLQAALRMSLSSEAVSSVSCLPPLLQSSSLPSPSPSPLPSSSPSPSPSLSRSFLTTADCAHNIHFYFEYFKNLNLLLRLFDKSELFGMADGGLQRVLSDPCAVYFPLTLSAYPADMGGSTTPSNKLLFVRLLLRVLQYFKIFFERELVLKPPDDGVGVGVVVGTKHFGNEKYLEVCYNTLSVTVCLSTLIRLLPFDDDDGRMIQEMVMIDLVHSFFKLSSSVESFSDIQLFDRFFPMFKNEDLTKSDNNMSTLWSEIKEKCAFLLENIPYTVHELSITFKYT